LREGAAGAALGHDDRDRDRLAVGPGGEAGAAERLGEVARRIQQASGVAALAHDRPPVFARDRERPRHGAAARADDAQIERGAREAHFHRAVGAPPGHPTLDQAERTVPAAGRTGRLVASHGDPSLGIRC
jgi:hypothetical protein